MKRMCATQSAKRSNAACLSGLLLLLVAAGSALAIASAARVERLDPRLDALIPPEARVEIAADDLLSADGPVWSDGVLLFSDVPRNTVFRLTRRGGVDAVLRPSGYTGEGPYVGAAPGSAGLAIDARGRLVLCQQGDRRVARREPDGSITPLAERFEGKRLNSPNDLAYAADGALYFTDPPFGLARTFDDPARELSFQGVFRLAPDGALRAVVTDLRAPNGLAFSPDGRTLYVSNGDNKNPVWMAYPVQPDGGVGPGRVFADARAFVADGEGVPHGLTVDRDGNVFAAGPGGVHVFAPDGTRLGRIVTGMPTSNVAWGDDGGTLYITTQRRVLRLPTSAKGRVGPPAK